MDSTMRMAAELAPRLPRSKKKSGTPISAPPPKQMSCLFVRLNRTFDFTFVFGDGNVGQLNPSFSNQKASRMLGMKRVVSVIFKC